MNRPATALATLTAAAALAAGLLAAPAASAAGSPAGSPARPAPRMTPAPPTPPAPVLVRGGGFESGGLADWTCEDARVTGAARWGRGALEGTTSTNSTGRCAQTVAVRPDTAYTLSAWVKGDWVHLGVTGYGSATSVPAAPDWTFVTHTFRTAATAHTVEIAVSGWYAQGRYAADEIWLRGDPPTGAPARPTGVTAERVLSRAVVLSWQPAARAAGYAVVDGTGAVVARAPGGATSAVVTVGEATTQTLRVVAENWYLARGVSDPVTVTTPADADSAPSGPRYLIATPGPAGTLWLAWEAVAAATDGYAVYVDGVLARRVPGPALQLDGLARDRTYRVEATGVNARGESPRSAPSWATTLPA
ncbi:fibronectin type III domain-containing protein [Spirilliplanes yamanashiensis]|uniref:Fibronectin type-III domain-containing protein n=1 Tax=Spirilliplanes yamanashiensis TaxID=42233 RepID=A0A8J4DKS3_9ACTN|nr:carbohydrate binding domain-containing protein [Spirilliplanes yamanashiensis]MDP9818761.1 hypothetical protein [Spirilliplanes yamanashiensis]GIJ05216.1 hypothetical protein Sya03_45680 [Spirilliplanes yamanashiensis]